MDPLRKVLSGGITLRQSNLSTLVDNNSKKPTKKRSKVSSKGNKRLSKKETDGSLSSKENTEQKTQKKSNTIPKLNKVRRDNTNALKNKTNINFSKENSVAKKIRKSVTEEAIQNLMEVLNTSLEKSPLKETFVLESPEKIILSSSYAKNYCYTSTPQKYCAEPNKEISGHFIENSLSESLLDVSPIKIPQEEEEEELKSPSKSLLSDISYDDIQLFDDLEKDIFLDNKESYAITNNNALHCKKKLFKTKKTENTPKKKRKEKADLAKKVKKDKTEDNFPKKSKKETIATKKLEEWASQINADFEEVDKFDLVFE